MSAKLTWACSNASGAGPTVAVSYKYATTNYRWVRNFDGEVASLKWWGVEDGDNVYGVLCHALNTCKRLGIKQLRLDERLSL